MSDEFLPAFVARWSRIRERYEADPDEHGVKHLRLAKLWKHAGGLCHLCGRRVPHPFLELERITDRNAPTADHLVPALLGGARTGKNLRLAHRWCNGRRGSRELSRSLKRDIGAEARTTFYAKEANEQSTTRRRELRGLPGVVTDGGEGVPPLETRSLGNQE